MRSRSLQWLAIAAIIITGGIHLKEAHNAFGDAAYKGVLFAANGLGAVIATVGILRQHEWGWWLGLAISALAMVAYILSRTVGLPNLPAEPDAWLEPAGVASLVSEGLFLIAFLATRSHRGDRKK